MPRLSDCCPQHSHNILQSLRDLLSEVISLELSGNGVPSHLAGYEDPASARCYPVRIPFSARPSFRRNDSLVCHLTGCSIALCRNTYRWILPVLVFGSDSTNSMLRGYLYGAICCFTKSCNWEHVV